MKEFIRIWDSLVIRVADIQQIEINKDGGWAVATARGTFDVAEECKEALRELWETRRHDDRN